MSNSRAPRQSRLAQLRRVFAETRRVDPQMLPLVAGAAAAVLLLFVVIGLITDEPLVWTLVGIPLALLVGLQLFSRRAQSAALRNLAGRPGAAAAVLQTLRRPWRVIPAVAFNRRQDLVHIAVGRAGVVLVAEGSRAGAAALLRQERRRVARAVGDVPIHEILAGDGEGRVPLSRLSREFLKFPRKLKRGDVDALEQRLRALGSSTPPMPKGPMPRAPRRPR